MSWLKQSDIAANHPLVLRVLEWKDYDERLLNEMYGWVNRCATMSAAHDMDYIVEIGVARSLAWGRYEALRDAAVFCGIFFEKEITEETKDDEGNVIGTEPRQVLKLVEEKDLFHMILRSEKEWEAQRQYDNRNPERSGPVRKRDGDECRWCGRITRWDSDRRSARMGTIDHLKPGEKNAKVEDRVVACKSCNSSRQDGDNWDKELRPVPTNPYYSAATAKWLMEKCGFDVKPTEERKETKTPAKSPADQKQAVEPPARGEDPAKVRATDTSGATIASDTATEQTSAVESPGATDSPAQVVRSHSDLAAFPSVESIEARAEAVEPPAKVDGPAADLSNQAPEPEKATANPGRSGARSNQAADQTPIKHRSIDNQKPTTGDSYVRSGFAGSGRDGLGRAGLGLDGHAGAAPGSSSSVRESKPRRRRNRPRRRKN
ncbi:hypothetical protein FQA45_00240 [Glutamicibacter halophytocola]|uniref:HNH endonuclease n=1 Tax=Glutamicibacter halophytocola TaxID=1933880 RepID=A0ABX5Y420_9MICC|nr:hypothetical protein [Glutamicibacter halophytocola]QDY64863.1 hypothetical protein FQA45_00240 [Glutamicibacter halophytocola]